MQTLKTWKLLFNVYITWCTLVVYLMLILLLNHNYQKKVVNSQSQLIRQVNFFAAKWDENGPLEDEKVVKLRELRTGSGEIPSIFDKKFSMQVSLRVKKHSKVLPTENEFVEYKIHICQPLKFPEKFSFIN